MQIEDLILENDARGSFENMSDLDTFIVVAVDHGEIFYGARSIPTSIRSASLVLWVGVHSSSLGLRTLGSTRP
jgi:hypothetical protein